MLDNAEFDGVLMDCQMPVMDGYTATKLLREQERFRELPVIALTANVMAGDIEKVLNAGMNDHIGKPINVRELYTTMAKWIMPSSPVSPQERIPNHEPDKDAIEPLPDLAGISVEKGLATANGDPKLYRKLLLKYKDSYGNFAEAFNHALGSEDKQEPQRLAHSLKAVAGNIGATAVQRAAEDLEVACKQADVPPTELLDTLLSALSETLAGCRKLRFLLVYMKHNLMLRSSPLW